jgi:thiosulfate dehydrogenase
VKVRALGLLIVVAAAGCGARPALEYGRALFDDPGVSDAKSNPFRCASCHDVTADSPLRPGYTLYDAAVRPSWWGGSEVTLLDAVNQCVVELMRGHALTVDDEKSRALYVYLQSLAPDGSAPARPLTIVQDIVDVPSGDAGRGAQVWRGGCQGCHGDPHTGKGRIADIASIVPDESLAAHGTSPTMGARPVVIEKVRHGKFFRVGGNMPLFSLEVVSDEQLGDLLAYLESFGLPRSPSP